MDITTPAGSEGFTDLGDKSGFTVYQDYANQVSAKTADTDLQIQDWLRTKYRGLNLTAIPSTNAPLLQFAYAGNATATLDTLSEPVVRWRGYAPASRRGGTGGLGDATFFAKYHYVWSGEDFIMYSIGNGGANILYILKEPNTAQGETDFSHCSIVDKLILEACSWARGDQDKFIYVYDGYWTASRQLWDQIQDSNWEDVILDPAQKTALQSVSNTFFDSKDIYKKYGVPWKRGLIFYGPPGNGKTISIKALMHELYYREKPIPTLYVKYAPSTYDIRNVFSLARQYSPCLLIMEDIETIVTSKTRSYFFNEVDGLENNDGILMVASTNYLERLDPGLANRPSRFDRKYLFPLPDLEERTLYAQYWHRKLAKSAPKIDFPDSLCRPIAKITQEFSFAYMQEAFVAALLDLARNHLESELSGLESDIGETVCEMEALVGRKRVKGDTEDRFLVRWKGLPEAIHTWEPVSVIHEEDHGSRLLLEYLDRNPGATAEYDNSRTALDNFTANARNMYFDEGKHDGLENNKLWKAIKKSVAVLRQDLRKGEDAASWKTPDRYLATSTGSRNDNNEYDENASLSRIPTRSQSKHGPRRDGPSSPSSVVAPEELSHPSFSDPWGPLGLTGNSPDNRGIHLTDQRFRFAHGHGSRGADEDGSRGFGPLTQQLADRRRNGVTAQQLYSAGVGKYHVITATAFEQKKCPWE